MLCFILNILIESFFNSESFSVFDACDILPKIKKKLVLAFDYVNLFFDFSYLLFHSSILTVVF